ncbi:disrupted in renal carcinoma protein 2 homolog [Mizuhopecten yessoensis]|uniref:disrupted in renal carcinoma protein 2 homolog n=1 Tax=Mizuhopecten yessoensis TaxID=6573 RepID=UPI000B4573A2|nr:disrupted in renal carcinoma protein 2 homolog [Mizuhopecten yessoensis]
MAMDEVKPLLHVKPKTYARRWWVLIYVSLANIFTTGSWNAWGPISQSVEFGFGWDDSIIADILNVGRIGMFVGIIPLSYLVDKKGIRLAMIISNVILLMGYVLRCLIDQTTSIWPAMLGQVIVGGANGIGYCGPSAMSVAWFPPNERATATSIAVMSTYIGLGIAYIINPLLVSTPLFDEVEFSYRKLNQSELANYTDHDLSLAANSTSVSMANVVLNKDIIQDETMTLMYIETGIAAAFVIVAVALVPDAPPTPPSHSANAIRMEYTKVFLHIIRSGYLSLLLLFTGVMIGMYATWVTIFGITFEHLDITQDEAGWLGFGSLIASSVVGFISARFSDVCASKLKTILMVMLVISSLMFLWVSLLCSQYIEYSREQLYVSTILGCAFLNGCVPLLYEQICNAAFPIPEGIIVGISALVTMLAGIFYLLPLSIIEFEDNTWLEWSILVVCVVGCIVILITPQRNGRADLEVSVRVTKTTYYERLGSEHEDLHVSEKTVPENA